MANVGSDNTPLRIDDVIATELNRYFTGKYLTERDLRDEQGYFLSRGWLRNRLLEGWGVVCGFDVSFDTRPGCAHWVTIGAGLAIDPLGRELLLLEARQLEIDESLWGRTLDIVATFCRRAVEPVPALLPDGEDGPDSFENNRYREGVEIYADVPDARAEGEQDRPTGPLYPYPRDDVDVVIARLEWPTDAAADDNRYRIVKQPFRRATVGALTRIAAVNWIHGEDVPIQALAIDDARAYGGWGLCIAFDGALPDDPDPIFAAFEAGLSRETMEVSYELPDGSLHRLDPIDEIHLLDGRTLVYPVDPEELWSLAGSTVFVRLKCDFIIDVRGQAVDGTHLAGRLPSGNGTQGGTFESWFTIVDAQYDAPAAQTYSDREDDSQGQEGDA